MAITNLDGLIASTKGSCTWMKTSTRTTVAVTPFTTAGVTGNPTGTLNAGNTANGVVPTDDGTEGPALPAVTNSLYISRIMYGSSVACTMFLYDRVFACGAYAYNTDTTLTSIPSYSARIPNGDYTGTELWFEAVTAFTGTPTVQVNYLDQGGNSGDTGAFAVSTSGAILGRMGRFALASGDTGISGITRIRGSSASGGTFNVSVMRPLWMGRVPVAGYCGVDDFLKTGLPQIYATSCLWVVLLTDSTAVGLPYINIQYADG
jgi:hypothetical protein